MPLAYSLLILTLFYVLLLLEFFVPSGGILGVAAAIAGLTAVIVASTHSAVAGLSMFAVITATTPVILAAMIRVWPRTMIGRRMLNRRPGELTPSTAPDRTLPDGRPLHELVGQVGVAKTDLLPSGLVSIDGCRLDAISVGVAIDNGTHVVVTKIQAGKIQVRPALESEVAAHRGESLPPTIHSPDVLDADLSTFEIDDLK